MTVERGLRLMAGVMVLLSLALAHYRFALLALADGFRRAQPAAVGFYQLVPGHGHPARHGPERCQLRREVREPAMRARRQSGRLQG